jgi:hypothetical protein
MIRILQPPSITNVSQPVIHDLRRGAERMPFCFVLPGPAISLFWTVNSLLGQKNIPCSIAQGILLQAIEPSRQLIAKIVEAGRNFANSLLFSLFSGNWRPGLSWQPAWLAIRTTFG